MPIKGFEYTDNRSRRGHNQNLTARTGQGLWDKAYEEVVEQLIGMKRIDDRELLHYLVTHAQSLPSYKGHYGGKLPQAIQDARDFLKRMPFRPEWAAFKTQAVPRLLESESYVERVQEELRNCGAFPDRRRGGIGEMSANPTVMPRIQPYLNANFVSAPGGVWKHKTYPVNIHIQGYVDIQISIKSR